MISECKYANSTKTVRHPDCTTMVEWIEQRFFFQLRNFGVIEGSKLLEFLSLLNAGNQTFQVNILNKYCFVGKSINKWWNVGCRSLEGICYHAKNHANTKISRYIQYVHRTPVCDVSSHCSHLLSLQVFRSKFVTIHLQ